VDHSGIEWKNLRHGVVNRFSGEMTVFDFKAYNYGCVMAVLPEEISSRIRAFSLAIPDSDIYEIDDVEYGRPAEIHCTVKYGLHTDNVQDVASVISGHDLVCAELGDITVFDNPDCAVLKIDIESVDLAEINRLISSNLKCTDSHPVYLPHVTIAYLRHRVEDPLYYQRFLCGMFKGTEVWFDRLQFSTPQGNKTWISLEGGYEKTMAAGLHRIAHRIAYGH